MGANVMSVMTPDNLDEFEIFNYFEIANCLGVGPKYQRIHGQNPGIHEHATTKLNNMVNWWKATQGNLSNVATNFIETLENESKKKGYNFTMLISQLRERTGISSNTSQTSQPKLQETTSIPSNPALGFELDCSEWDLSNLKIHATGNVTQPFAGTAPIKRRKTLGRALGIEPHRKKLGDQSKIE